MLACPKCTAYMFPGLKKGIQLDFCSHCEGIWLDKGELSQVVGTTLDIPWEGQEKATSTKFPCPRCGMGLATEHYRQDDPLLIDSCMRCKGVYLDKGELEKIENLAQQVQISVPPQHQARMNEVARRSEALSAVYKTANPVAKLPEASRASFITQVYMLLTMTLIACAGGAYYGVISGLGEKYFLPAVIAEIVVLIACWLARRVDGLNFLLLFSFTAIGGFTMSATLNHFLLAGKAHLIWEAAGLTAAIFAALSAYVHITKQDFEWLGGFLFAALLTLSVTGITFLFFPNRFGEFVWSAVSALVFSGYILFDTSRVVLKYDTDDVVSAVIDLYLDIVNLFLDLLRVLDYLTPSNN